MKASDLRTELANRFIGELDGSVAATGSPIEEMMLWALLLAWHRDLPDWSWWACDFFSPSELPGCPPLSDGMCSGFAIGGAQDGLSIEIIVQPELLVRDRRCRLDIAVVATQWTRTDVSKLSREQRKLAQLYRPDRVFFIDVECDGHDFHERTKEQAARDKKRDRDLQSLGWIVARFTGSEIFKDPKAAARQVKELLAERRRSGR